MTLSFRVEGIPIPTQYRQTKTGILYCKPAAKLWQRQVGWAAKLSLGSSKNILLCSSYTGPVSILADFHMPIAKGQVKHYPVGNPHLQKPDTTNLWKSVEDGLKRIMFADDATVWHVQLTKCWSNKPGVELRINLEELEV